MNNGYSMSIRGSFPLAEQVKHSEGSIRRAFFTTPFDWSKEYLCQEKQDGWNAVVIKKNGETRWGANWDQYSVLQAMLPCLNDYLPDNSIMIGEAGYGTNYETKLALKNGFHRFVIFDLIQWKGKNISSWTTEERYDIIQCYQAGYAHPYVFSSDRDSRCTQMLVVPTIYLHEGEANNREACWSFFKSIIDRGGEGCVLKEMGAPYIIGGETKQMYKIKKYLTKDYVVLGFEGTNAETYLAQGMRVSAMYCGLYVNGALKNVTKTSGFDFEWRKKFSDHPEEYIGKVVELGGYEIFKTGAMRHSSLLRFREDRKPEECVL